MTTTTSIDPNFLIPWPCLVSDTDPPISNNNITKVIPSPVTVTKKQQKTFAQALSNVCDVPISQLPQPCKKGDDVAIEIPEEEYIAGLEECNHGLQGKMIWPKGSTPVSIDKLRSKLLILWKSIGKWGITSIGKGFYEFTFSSLEDLRRVRSVGSWSLNPGVLKLFTWTKEFSSNRQQTSVQVWIRIFGLSQEYWRKRILFAIAGGVGTPICTDSITSKPRLERTFGHYARVLVDMNFSQELVHRILVERKGYAFYVDIEYENLPDFCTNCQCTGHYVEICKRLLNNDKQVAQAEQKKNTVGDVNKIHKNQRKDNKDQWVVKKPGSVNLEPDTTNRSKEDLELENEINVAIEMQSLRNKIQLNC